MTTCLELMYRHLLFHFGLHNACTRFDNTASQDTFWIVRNVVCLYSWNNCFTMVVLAFTCVVNAYLQDFTMLDRNNCFLTDLSCLCPFLNILFNVGIIDLYIFASLWFYFHSLHLVMHMLNTFEWSLEIIGSEPS